MGLDRTQQGRLGGWRSRVFPSVAGGQISLPGTNRKRGNAGDVIRQNRYKPTNRRLKQDREISRNHHRWITAHMRTCLRKPNFGQLFRALKAKLLHCIALAQHGESIPPNEPLENKLSYSVFRPPRAGGHGFQMASRNYPTEEKFMRSVLNLTAMVGLFWAACSATAMGQWPSGNCNNGGGGGWHAHMQNVRANFFGGANCGRGINQQHAEDLWGTYCQDDCTLFSGSGGCGTGCGTGCGNGGGWGRGGNGCFGYGACSTNQGCGGAGGGCGLFGGHGNGGLFGGHGGCGLFGGRGGGRGQQCGDGCGCDQGSCFGWPGSNCGCSAGSACGGGLLTGGRHFRCHRGMHTFDRFNDCDGNDHGCHVGNCGSRGRFFRFAVGQEFGCGDINSCVGNSISAGCGCDGGYSIGAPVSAPAVQPLQGTHGPTLAVPVDPQASPSDHKN